MTYNPQTIRDLERSSIRAFVERHRDKLRGRVLDFGCGTQPYRDLVDGEYVPYDAGLSGYAKVGDESLLGYRKYDAALVTQVSQYNAYQHGFFLEIHDYLCEGGWLVLTGPTNWAEVEPIDMVRLTRAGIWQALESAGFGNIHVEQRASLNLDGFELSLGYGAVAQR